MKEKERFTILLEDIRSQNRVVADGVITLSRQLDEAREEAKKDNQETRALLFSAAEIFHQKIDETREKVKEIRAELKETRTELKSEIIMVNKKVDETREEVKEIRAELKETRTELKETRRELGNKIDRLAVYAGDHSKRLERLEGVVFV